MSQSDVIGAERLEGAGEGGGGGGEPMLAMM